MTNKELNELCELFSRFTSEYFPYGENDSFVNEFSEMVKEVREMEK